MYWVMPPPICFVSVSYAPIKEIDFISKMRKAAKYVSVDAKTSGIIWSNDGQYGIIWSNVWDYME